MYFIFINLLPYSTNAKSQTYIQLYPDPELKGLNGWNSLSTLMIESQQLSRKVNISKSLRTWKKGNKHMDVLIEITRFRNRPKRIIKNDSV